MTNREAFEDWCSSVFYAPNDFRWEVWQAATKRDDALFLSALVVLDGDVDPVHSGASLEAVIDALNKRLAQ